MTTDEGEKVNEYVVGKTIDLKNRKESYDSNKLHDFKIIYYKVCNGIKAMDILEAIVLIKLGKYRCKAGRDVFLLPKFEGISTFTNIFDECIKFFEDVDENHIVFPRRTQNKILTDEKKEKMKKYQEEHKEEIKQKTKIYREKNKEKIVEKGKNYYEENKEEIKEKTKEYQEKNKEKIAEKKKIYREENKEEVARKKKKFYDENKEQILEKKKEYYNERKEEIIEKNLLHYNKNKEKLKQKSKEYHEKNKSKLSKKEICECGSEVSHVGMLKHKKTKKHEMQMKIILN